MKDFKLISGTAIAQQIREELKLEIDDLRVRHGIQPGLATIIVGQNPASQTYVNSKIKICRELGIFSSNHTLPETVSETDLLEVIDRLNTEPKINGILVQLPLPNHINEGCVLTAINPEKDVDGFHPINVGRMIIGQPCLLPCTPAGIQQLIVRSGIKTDGAEVVVVGRSNIVGKPITNILMQKAPGANATVTVCHSATRDIAVHTRRADILIAAIGKPRFITADMVKPGSTVIDVGTNEIGKTPEGKRILCGDVDFDNVKLVAGAITPVPGGVGPMTIVMLMVNTLKAAKLSHGFLVER